ncbi:MAG: type II secretion system protein [Deltaproteobacteria bacterium]
MYIKVKKEMVSQQLKGLRHNNSGFTLMELIIVMTILAILVTLALLYYGNVTDSAYRDALLADLNQTDKAIALYEREYNSLPMVETTPIDLHTALDSANVPPKILAVNGLVTGYTVNRANANFLKYLKKTTFLFKGHETDDTRGAGMLYYVDTVNTVDTGTSTAGTSITIKLEDDSRADDYYNGCTISLTDHNCAGQSRTIINYDAASTTATIDSAWEGAAVPSNSDYEIRPPVKKGDLLFVQSATSDRLIIKDEKGNPIYK